ncbi:MAG: oxygen-dependent coproporphyrinogen oxidase [Thermonemataceae bacterium]|nr:oxygen-dependent coproporphyrinogen oxidase [Thermonemataceae bacterium]
MQKENEKNSKAITEAFKNLQDSICLALEQADGLGKFLEENWQREGGGGGRTRVLSKGNVIEKGGVNFSEVFGEVTPMMAQKLQMKEGNFLATGVSIVLHPHNPHVPIIHMNIRYFELEELSGEKVYWFGGGIDLTPHYVDEEDAYFFHQNLKDVCQKHHSDFYPKFKIWADDYFYLKHRQETRGIGGIFFDRLSQYENLGKEDIFAFVMEVGNSFAPIYTKLMAKNKMKPYTETEKQWQYLRRGRYVEFNLVYDAGTKFGLETNGRTESILMSLPPQAHWLYNFQVEEGSKEQQTLEMLKKGISWV